MQKKMAPNSAYIENGASVALANNGLRFPRTLTLFASKNDSGRSYYYCDGRCGPFTLGDFGSDESAVAYFADRTAYAKLLANRSKIFAELKLKY